MIDKSRQDGFPPVVCDESKVLILGSLPSRKSIELQQYYGHPQNQFWRIMGELFGAGPNRPYGDRVNVLLRSGVAVWDVLESSVRRGSMDASIDASNASANDFAAFLASYSNIHTICFNGRKSEQLFQRLAHSAAAQAENDLSYVSLPSTSPAHAAMSFAEKLERWNTVRDAAGQQKGP